MMNKKTDSILNPNPTGTRNAYVVKFDKLQ